MRSRLDDHGFAIVAGVVEQSGPPPGMVQEQDLIASVYLPSKQSSKVVHMRELIELEERGWRALSTEGDASRIFYESVLREDAVMLFPGGLRIQGRARILESLGSQSWQSFRMEDSRVIRLSSDTAAVIYKVYAQREGSPPYVALISSTYAHDQAWRLVLHQQTPV